MTSSASVVAVVVSYQRRDLLLECLRALRGQTRSPDAVVVVDNASTDGAPQAVAQAFPEVDLVRLPRNTGGAGGFAAGLAQAMCAHGADLVWLMDDDTVPRADALARSLACLEEHPGRPALVASRVLWTDGRDHPMNTPRIRPGARVGEVMTAAAVKALPVRSASFVSVLVEAAAVRASGLPLADYFLWNDDFEFTTRLLRDRAGLICLASVVEHRTAVAGGPDADPGERFYYEVRNKLWLFRTGPGLRARERLLYGGSTARRWLRTLAVSRRRALLLRAGARGVRDGLLGSPRPTAQVLAGLGPVSGYVAAVEAGGS